MGTIGNNESGLDRYIERARRAEKFDRETEHALAVQASEGDTAARDRLVAANLRHVVSIALKYRGYGVALGDLVAEGNVGLCIAATKFDPQHGTRFVTYASYWIRAHILECVLRSRTLVGGGVGAFRSKTFFRLHRERARLDALVADRDERRTLLAAAFGKTEPEMDEMLTRLDSRDVSLDAPLHDDGGESGVERLVSPDASAHEVFVARTTHHELSRSIDQALSLLDDRERRIVSARALGEDDVSLADLAREFGVSRERARQLEARAHGKLRRELSRFADMAA